ncbi:MAG: hypothetical protein GY934_04515, partial [Gammaproteobacteria bacterium]|nr:hypothetical protein [Gammaproteobacteria bacterium]
KIQAALRKKGFVDEEAPHHHYLHHEIDGQRTGAYAYFSRGSAYKDYGPKLLNSLKRTLKLDSKNQLELLVDCPLTAEKYIVILRQKGYL